MIVVDTNIIGYFYLPNRMSSQVDQLKELQPQWAAPELWRSEFRNVLTLYLRKNLITFEKANSIYKEAEGLMSGWTFKVRGLDVLRLINTSSCSAYDCEFAALAEFLSVPLVTMDKKILKEFPSLSVSLQDALHLRN